jgi:hypothetical protein
VTSDERPSIRDSEGHRGLSVVTCPVSQNCASARCRTLRTMPGQLSEEREPSTDGLSWKFSLAHVTFTKSFPPPSFHQSFLLDDRLTITVKAIGEDPRLVCVKIVGYESYDSNKKRMAVVRCTLDKCKADCLAKDIEAHKVKWSLKVRASSAKCVRTKSSPPSCRGLEDPDSDSNEDTNSSSSPSPDLESLAESFLRLTLSVESSAKKVPYSSTVALYRRRLREASSNPSLKPSLPAKMLRHGASNGDFGRAVYEDYCQLHAASCVGCEKLSYYEFREACARTIRDSSFHELFRAVFDE